MADKSQEIITIDIAEVVIQTDAAFLVRIEEMGFSKKFWCPKSLCSYDDNDPDNMTADVPRWLYEGNQL